MKIFDSDINDEELDNLFEHRGKPDPEKLAERTAMHKRGIERHKNAIAREKEYEERRKARLVRIKEMEKMGKTKSEIDRELGTDEEFEKKYNQPEKSEKKFSSNVSKIASQQESKIKQTYQRIKKQDSQELDNESYDKYKNHISKAKEESEKSLKSIHAKNSHQAKAKTIIGKSVNKLSDSINSSIRDGEKVNLEDLISEDYEKSKNDFSKFMENQKLKEDDWKTEESDNNWYKKYDKDDDIEVENDDEERDYHKDYQDLQEKNDFYTRKLERLQKEYNKKKSFYSGNQHKLEQLKKEYGPKIKSTKDKISQTDIKSYDDYVKYVDDKNEKRNEKLRKNPVVNWFKMSYFRAIHPIVKMFSSVESFRSFLWDD